jgi:hypothetical protein
MADVIKGKVLPDGRIKSTTGEVGQENHQNAEAFFALIAKLTGGETSREARGTHEHVHQSHEHHHHHGA